MAKVAEPIRPELEKVLEGVAEGKTREKKRAERVKKQLAGKAFLDLVREEAKKAGLKTRPLPGAQNTRDLATKKYLNSRIGLQVLGEKRSVEIQYFPDSFGYSDIQVAKYRQIPKVFRNLEPSAIKPTVKKILKSQKKYLEGTTRK